MGGLSFYFREGPLRIKGKREPELENTLMKIFHNKEPGTEKSQKYISHVDMVVVEVDVDPNVQLTLIGLYCHQESCTEKEFLPLLEEMIKHMKERKDKTGKDFNIMGDLNLSILPD